MVLQEVRDSTGKDARDARGASVSHKAPLSARGEPQFVSADEAIRGPPLERVAF